jgi:hypothetical protein
VHRTPRSLPVALRGRRRAADVDVTLRRYLMYVLLPSWSVPAMADYWYHRRSHIEDTTGLREAWLHTAMMAEMGVAVTAALTLRISRTVFLGMVTCAAAHAGTSAADVRLAYDSPREVTPGEQHAHGFLEVLPWTALVAIGCLHWQDLSDPAPDLPRFAWRQPPLPRWYRAAALTAAVAGVAGPYADEMRRCFRAARRRRSAEAV